MLRPDAGLRSRSGLKIGLEHALLERAGPVA
jgi:hypothetical protein